MHITDFPIELFIEILLYVDGKSIGKCRRVCKKWLNIINGNEKIWKIACHREFKYASIIARERCESDCKWYNLYKNLSCWNQVTAYPIRLRDCYQFRIEAITRTLSLKMRDLSTVTEFTWSKIANNSYALVIYFRFAIIIVRPVDNIEYKAEKVHQANGFSLWDSQVYFFKGKDVYVVDLESNDLESYMIYKSAYKLKEIHHFDGKTYLFTDCGQIITIDEAFNATMKTLNCLPVWIPQIKHIHAINDRNYIGFSRNLFNIESDKCRHLYFEFPYLTAVFFYGDIVIVGMKSGDLWLYRLSSQIVAAKPVFEYISRLPSGHYAIQIEVVERKRGPVVTITSNSQVFFMEIDFFDFEVTDELPLSVKRLAMYKRMLCIREALQARSSLQL